MKLEIPQFKTNKELFNFLIENKSTLIAQKLNTFKHGDHVGGVTSEQSANKALEGTDNVQIKAVINTTNFMDSHKDVHLPGLWKKSLSENKRILHVQEHKSQSFDKIIADGEDLKAYTETISWKELGYNATGTTEALVFDSTIKASRNPYMFNQYKNGYVKNHSVGMRYVKIFMAINDEDFPEEKATWDKYYNEIINKEEADSHGYFWAVTEAKVIEGSAVPIGSNPITPTLEPLKGTPTKAAESTFDLSKAIKNVEFKI